MSELKCPFCQQELKPQTMDGEWLECWNCSYHEPSHHPFPQRILCGTKELWQALIDSMKEYDLCYDALVERTKELERTRKALDVAKKALQELKDIIACPPDISYETGVSMYADGALQEITALEQKE